MEQQIAVCSRTAPHDAAVGLPSPQEGEGAMEPPRMVLQSGSPPPCGEGQGVGAAS
jgi:hypothetical protein